MANSLKHQSTREFKGSSIPVGSRVGKILLNSVDASKIMDAVRTVASGKSTGQVQISKSTAESLLVSLKK